MGVMVLGRGLQVARSQLVIRGCHMFLSVMRVDIVLLCI